MTYQRHQPAHWTAGEALHLTTVTEHGYVNSLLWYKGDWLTEGELSVMVHNQLNEELFEAADQSGMMLTAVQVYDDWFDSVR